MWGLPQFPSSDSVWITSDMLNNRQSSFPSEKSHELDRGGKTVKLLLKGRNCLPNQNFLAVKAKSTGGMQGFAFGKKGKVFSPLLNIWIFPLSPLSQACSASFWLSAHLFSFQGPHNTHVLQAPNQLLLSQVIWKQDVDHLLTQLSMQPMGEVEGEQLRRRTCCEAKHNEETFIWGTCEGQP